MPLRLVRASSMAWGQKISAIIQGSCSLEPVTRKQGDRHVHPWGEQVSRPDRAVKWKRRMQTGGLGPSHSSSQGLSETGRGHEEGIHG